MRLRLAIWAGRLATFLLRLLKRQASTFPGRVVEAICPQALSQLASRYCVWVITGTNGKTTTTMLTVSILRKEGVKVDTNPSGANLRYGLLTAFILASASTTHMVLEVDEAAFASCAAELNPERVLVTNLFRDQLDRYGELEHVYCLIKKGLQTALPKYLFLNTDDPLVSALALEPSLETVHKLYFGAFDTSECHQQEPVLPEASCSPKAHVGLCPHCHLRLTYERKTIAHLGFYHCPHCHYERVLPYYQFMYRSLVEGSQLRFWKGSWVKLLQEEGGRVEESGVIWSLRGLYNAYNACAALALCDYERSAGTAFSERIQSLADAQPSFGRLERIALDDHKSLCMVLVKNPAGLEQALSLLEESEDVGGVLWALNNNPPDGCDISWIWDADLERYRLPHCPMGFTGLRRGDIALRLSYALDPLENLSLGPIEEDACALAMRLLQEMASGRCLYLVLNYTAMLELRLALAKTLGYEMRWTVVADPLSQGGEQRCLK